MPGRSGNLEHNHTVDADAIAAVRYRQNDVEVSGGERAKCLSDIELFGGSPILSPTMSVVPVYDSFCVRRLLPSN